MSDIILTVDYQFTTDLNDAVTKLINNINANAPKIKVGFDIDSTTATKLQQQTSAISASMKNVGSGTTASSTASLKETAQAATQTQQAISNLVGVMNQKIMVTKNDIANTTTEYRIETQYANLIKRMNNFINNYSAAKKSLSQSSRDAYANVEKEVTAIEASYKAYSQGKISVEQFRSEIASTNSVLAASTTEVVANGDATQKLSKHLGGLASKFSSWLTVSQVIMQGVRAIRQMISVSIELDDAMTQMQIVTKASADEMDEFAESAAAAAQRVGSSISDFVDSATTYARLGYDMDESSQLAEYTAMLQNVGDIDVSDAQDAITSIIKAFDIDSSEIESVMDKLVTTGNNFPISVSQIAEGMTNASSALSAAGNSFDESVALLTAANTTIQDASKASTGLRTIAARIRNTTTELDELGETMTEASYEELVQMLTDCNVALTDANGEYRSTYDIMSDIADEWENMTSMEQAALATAMSGTRQQAVFYSIIEQFQEASGAMTEMADSAGALDSAYSIYMDSTSAHINQFKAAFQELGSDVFKSDGLQAIIDVGTNVITVLDKIIDKLGTLPILLSAIGGALFKKSFS